ncbi:MAG: Imm1 family immunity protein [Verrucomicrobia bacterium]|nr:Imm1 family immunity protein [Verrucomicrobiota bacterium]
MQWHIEAEGQTHEVRDAAQLETWLQAAAAKPIADLFLERVRLRRRPGWEKFIYRILGLTLPENESKGSLGVSLAPAHAMAVFTQSDDHDGEIAVMPGAVSPSQKVAEFTTGAGEKFTEPAANSIPRDLALAALREFYRTGNRPECVAWKKVSERKRGR